MAATGIADEISPMYVGASAFVLSLTDPLTPALARKLCGISVDYSACEPEGANLPLELLITGPSAVSFQRRIFRRILPAQFDFLPVEGGNHQLLLREVGHNRWLGSLTVAIVGDTLIP